MKTHSRSLRLRVGAVVLCVAGVAAAQPTPEDRAAATELFKQGRALMDQKQYDAACAKLAESQRLDPGGGTILNLAQCHELQGRTATAWSEYAEALGVARRDGRPDRIQFATDHIATLEPKLPRLTILVPADSDLDGLELQRDGTVIGRAAWGTAIPVDPGAHAVNARAPGHTEWTTSVTLVEAQQVSVSVPALEAVAAPVPVVAPMPARAPAPAPVVAPAPAPPPPTGDHAIAEHHRVSVPGLIVATVGLVGVGVGSYFGLHAISKRHASDDQCPGGHCTDEGVSLNNEAKTSADISTIAFAVGAVGIGVGGYLLLSGGPADATARGPTAGVSLGGRW